MATWFKLLLALFIGLVAFKFRVTSAVVFDSVSKSWPLLAVTMTMIFTAIAGIIMWALLRLSS